MRATVLNLQKTLLQSGVSPSRLKNLIEESLEIENAVLQANKDQMPEDEYFDRQLSIVEAHIFCLMLSEPV